MFGALSWLMDVKISTYVTIPIFQLTNKASPVIHKQAKIFYIVAIEGRGHWKIYNIFNEEISAANFCYQVANWVTDMFCNIYLAKNGKIVNNWANTDAREKISIDL